MSATVSAAEMAEFCAIIEAQDAQMASSVQQQQQIISRRRSDKEIYKEDYLECKLCDIEKYMTCNKNCLLGKKCLSTISVGALLDFRYSCFFVLSFLLHFC